MRCRRGEGSGFAVSCFCYVSWTFWHRTSRCSATCWGCNAYTDGFHHLRCFWQADIHIPQRWSEGWPSPRGGQNVSYLAPLLSIPTTHQPLPSRGLTSTVAKHASSSSGSAAFTGKGHTLGSSSSPSSSTPPNTDTTKRGSSYWSSLDPQTKIFAGLVGAYILFWWLSWVGGDVEAE